MDLDGALDLLGGALSAVGAQRPSPPSALSQLEELEAAIAPMRLPSDVRRFWQRVDPATLRADTYPRLHGPDFALHCWRTGLAAYQPAALVQVAYSSHQCMSVELDIGEIAGGALFEWNLVDGDFHRRFNRLGEWLVCIAALIESGSFRRFDSSSGPWLLVSPPELESAELDRPPAPEPHPVYGTAVSVGRDILDWPAHWQRAAGLRPADLKPRGATHTIAVLLSSSPTTHVRGTIAARVIALMSQGAWTRARVDDGTAAIDIACPPATALLGPRLGDWFEFDVVVQPGKRTIPPNPETAAAGIDDCTDRIAVKLLARYGGPVGATAEAVRRVPPPT